MEKLTREHKQMVTDAVNAWIDPNNPDRSQNKLAEASKVNAAYISQIKLGKYTISAGGRDVDSNIGDNTFHKLADFLEIKFDGGLLWPSLRNFTRIEKICRKAQRKAIRYIIDGPTGQGKTFALERVAKKFSYAIYVKATRNMSANDLVEAILNEMGIAGNFRGIHQKIQAIGKKVNNQRGILIMIDELEQVRPAVYAVIKDVCDVVQGKGAMVICGFGLVNKLDLLAGKQRAGFPQLRRRFFGNVELLSEVSEQEVVDICVSEGITNKGAINVIVHECKDLDKLSQWIADIKDFQKQEGRKITGDEVVRMFGVKGLKMAA
jgi:hypothetical protein